LLIRAAFDTVVQQLMAHGPVEHPPSSTGVDPGSPGFAEAVPASVRAAAALLADRLPAALAVVLPGAAVLAAEYRASVAYGTALATPSTYMQVGVGPG
jgi:hypothetical protein